MGQSAAGHNWTINSIDFLHPKVHPKMHPKGWGTQCPFSLWRFEELPYKPAYAKGGLKKYWSCGDIYNPSFLQKTAYVYFILSVAKKSTELSRFEH